MKITTDLQEANELLQAYKGANSQIFLFTVSLKRLLLKLTLPNKDEVVYLIGISCAYITGKFRWENASLHIISETNKETDEIITRIFDKKADFELITTGGFSIAMGRAKELGNSFDNLFVNDK